MLKPAPSRSPRTLRLPAAPWTDVVGLARSLVAISGMLTLLFSSPDSLFTYRADTGLAPGCSAAGRWFAFCLTDRDDLWMTQIVCALVLLVAATGWRPRFTCIPQWYVHFSMWFQMSAPDGGDQLAAVLALLLIPIALTDSRRWHWSSAQSPVVDEPINAKSKSTSAVQWRIVIAVVFLVVIKLQGSVLYLQASLAKLTHDEWANGTSYYYWASDPVFGMSGWLHGMVFSSLDSPVVVTAVTWGPVLLEFLLAVSCLMVPRYRAILLPLALLFHAAIAISMGLWSFCLVMWALDFVLLYPIASSLRLFLPARIRLPSRSRYEEAAPQ